MSIQVVGLKENLRILAKMNPALRRQITRDFKDLAKPGVEEIEKLRPKAPDLPRGFQHNGRTGSGTVKKPTVDVNTGRARKRNITRGADFETLATIRIRTAKRDVATAIADMAGRAGNIAYSGRSRAYPGRPTGHALNGQGAKLIAKLNQDYGAASRFMWPGADKGLSAMDREFRALAARVEDELNRELGKIGTTARDVRNQMRYR